MRHPNNPIKQSGGFILVTGILLLIAITLVSIASMKSSNLDYKMSSNTAFKAQSFEASETARVLAGGAINEFIYERSWSHITTHPSIAFDSQFDPLKENAITEDPYRTASLNRDMSFNLAANENRKAMQADIYIVRAPQCDASVGSGQPATIGLPRSRQRHRLQR